MDIQFCKTPVTLDRHVFGVMFLADPVKNWTAVKIS